VPISQDVLPADLTSLAQMIEHFDRPISSYYRVRFDRFEDMFDRFEDMLDRFGGMFDRFGFARLPLGAAMPTIGWDVRSII
jgi:hypothetical protein